MALITDLQTLDYQSDGLPFAVFRSDLLSDTATLDYESGGLPFYAQSATAPGPLEATTNVVTVTAPTALLNASMVVTANIVIITAGLVKRKVLKRSFPLPREEWQAFSQQGVHVVEAIDFQDPTLIP